MPVPSPNQPRRPVDQIAGFIELLNWFFCGVGGLRDRDREVEKAETDGYSGYVRAAFSDETKVELFCFLHAFHLHANHKQFEYNNAIE